MFVWWNIKLNVNESANELNGKIITIIMFGFNS